MGAAGGRGGAAAAVTGDDVSAAYSAAARAWARGPDRVYARLARDLVAAAPRPLAGALVLDVGAGAGPVSRALREVGARCVALDLSWGMLALDSRDRPPAVVGDACELPLRARSFDAAVAACTLSHTPDPRRALAEAARVVRPGGLLLASAFPTGQDHPAKAAIDHVLQAFGYRPPRWYAQLKDHGEPATATRHALAALAAAAAAVEVTVGRRTVDVGLGTAEGLVDWRFGMASAAPFVAGLSPSEQASLRAAALRAVGPAPPPLVLDQLVLHARVGTDDPGGSRA